MASIKVHEQILKISRKLLELNDLMNEENKHLAPAHCMEIEYDCKALTAMMWRE